MIELSADAQRTALRALGRAVEAEADGKKLKRELAKELRGVIEPLRQQVIARLMRIRSAGHPGPSLRRAVARQTRAAVRFRGDNTGVSLVQRARGMPRDFRYAGRALNRPEGWRPQALGGVRVQQLATPAEWFDQPVGDTATAVDARRAIDRTLEDMARRIARRAK